MKLYLREYHFFREEKDARQIIVYLLVGTAEIVEVDALSPELFRFAKY